MHTPYEDIWIATVGGTVEDDTKSPDSRKLVECVGGVLVGYPVLENGKKKLWR